MTGFCSTCYVTGGCDCSEYRPLVRRIKETLSYFKDEFPEHQHEHLWQAPVCRYAGGVTPNDLVEMLKVMEGK